MMATTIQKAMATTMGQATNIERCALAVRHQVIDLERLF